MQKGLSMETSHLCIHKALQHTACESCSIHVLQLLSRHGRLCQQGVYLGTGLGMRWEMLRSAAFRGLAGGL